MNDRGEALQTTVTEGQIYLHSFIFGNDNALADSALEQCYVSREDYSDSPILTGRWGTGKTAILLHENMPLTEALSSVAPEDKLLWYVPEVTFDLSALSELKQKYRNYSPAFVKRLEELWEAEILRIECAILARLYEYYGSQPGAHWKEIKVIAGANLAMTSVWRVVADMGAVILGDSRADQFRKLRESVTALASEETRRSVIKCLQDLHRLGKRPMPCVVIEPIDSPTAANVIGSTLDRDASLAQDMTNALLNVFVSRYEPSETQLIEIRLAVPWHRYKIDQLAFPHRLVDYVSDVSWDRQSLRTFINKRIEYEFRRVSRKVATKGRSDAWTNLFTDEVTNTHCSAKEDSFSYVLRHTHHRPRDVLQIARLAVRQQAVQKDAEGFDRVLRGLEGMQNRKITGEALHGAVAHHCHSQFGLRLTEAARRYDRIHELADSLRRISVPCPHEELVRRLGSRYAGDPEAHRAISELWESGVIGHMLEAKTESAIRQLRTRYGQDGLSVYFKDGKRIDNKWYLFEYSAKEDYFRILGDYSKDEDIEVTSVMHPLCFGSLSTRTTEEYPIGV